MLRAVAQQPRVLPIIFVHARWRTGSTFVWSRFRQSQGLVAYYEIFNEGLKDLAPSDVLRHAPRNWNSKHPDCSPYFAEFLPLIHAGGGIVGGDPAMAIDLFIPKAGPRGQLSQAEIDYVARLIDHAERLKKVPVLTDTRTLARVTGLKTAFGGIHIVLYRNIFRQWASITEQAWNQNDGFMQMTRAQLLVNRHDPVISKLVDVFSVDDFSVRNPNSFYLFAGLQLYLYSRAVDSADVIIDVTRLACEPEYRVGVEKRLGAEGIDVDFSGAKSTIAFSLCPFDESRCKEWFGVLENLVCESATTAGRQFVADAIADIVEEFSKYEFYAGTLRSALETANDVIQTELERLSVVEKRQRNELEILRSRSFVQRLLHRNRIRSIPV